MRDPPLSPPSALAEFFRRMFLQNNLQTSPPAPQESHVGGKKNWNLFWSIFSPNQAILSTFRFFHFFPKFSWFSGKNRVKRVPKIGLKGFPEFFFWLESSSFCYLGAHAKICIPMISLSTNFFSLIGIFLFVLLGSPCKNLYSYDKFFWDIFEISPF